MLEIPATRLSLLVRLRDREEPDAWSDFVRLYGPVVYWFARRKGLQDSDAEDVTQEVLRSVVGAIANFSTEGRTERFRSWLFTLAARRLYDFRLRQSRQTSGSGDSEIAQQLQEQPTPEEGAGWEREWQLTAFSWAADKVRPRVSETTWQAFWLTAVDGLSGQAVAAKLHISVGAVFVAKSRVLMKLKEQIAAMDAD